MNKIQQLYKEWQVLQPLYEKMERSINQQFMVDFNYNSNIRRIQKLKTSGIIERIGSDKGGYWKICKEQ
jgi:predicted HTH transcriptional regulator